MSVLRHSRRPKSSQSDLAGEKARRTFSSTDGRAPGYRLSLDHFETVKRFSLARTSLVNEPGNGDETIAAVYEFTKRTQEMLLADWAQ